MPRPPPLPTPKVHVYPLSGLLFFGPVEPIPMDKLEMAADMLRNFIASWKKAENDPEEQHRLMHLIFERIWVKENAIVSVCLRPNYHVAMYHGDNLPADVPHIILPERKRRGQNTQRQLLGINSNYRWVDASLAGLGLPVAMTCSAT